MPDTNSNYELTRLDDLQKQIHETEKKQEDLKQKFTTHRMLATVMYFVLLLNLVGLWFFIVLKAKKG